MPGDVECDAETEMMRYQGVLAKTLQWAKVKRYRPILDADTKPEAPEWDGEGLPPAGVECEVLHWGEWRLCKIIAHLQQRADMVAVFAIDAGDGSKMIDAFVADCFRPIRSEEDKAVDEMAPIIRAAANDVYTTVNGSAADSIARALHRAGYRKTGGE